MKGKGVEGGREPGGLARQAARRPRGGDRGARRPAEHRRRGREAGRRASRTGSRPAPLELPRYELGSEVATRKAYGEALAALGSARGDVVAVDGEVSNSTFAEIFKAAHPTASSRCTSPSSRWSRPRSGSRRAAAARSRRPSPRSSRAPTTSSAWRRSVARDAVPLRLARRRLDRRGRPVADGARGHRVAARRPRLDRAAPVRRRTRRRSSSRRWPTWTGSRTSARSRPNTPVLYGPDEEFPIGGSKRRCADGDDVTIVGCGITVHEALKAADALAGEGSRRA